MSAETWTMRLRNAMARPHVTLALAVVFGLLGLDAILSIIGGDYDWYMDYWHNWYVQEAWYVISTPAIWTDAAKFYGKLFGSMLLASILPIVAVTLLVYNLIYKSAFKKWYLNGYEEGTVYAWLNPAGFWYKAYLQGAKWIYKAAGKEFVPPKTAKVDFLYSPSWRLTMKAFLNPLQHLKRFQGSDCAKITGTTSTAVNIMAQDSLIAKNTRRKVFTDAPRLNLNYAMGEIDLESVLRKTQSITGKGIGDSLYSNAGVHKGVLQDQGFIIPEPSKQGIKSLLMRRKSIGP